MNKSKFNILATVVLVTLFASVFAGCSSGSKGNNDISFDPVTKDVVIRVIDGNLTECRVVDANGNIAIETNGSTYKLELGLTENPGKISATGCKESTSGLRFNTSMYAVYTDADTVISPFSTLKEDDSEAFTKLASNLVKSENDLLYNFDSSDVSTLKVSNLISYIYSIDAQVEFIAELKNDSNYSTSAINAVNTKFPDDDKSLVLAFIDTIVNNTNTDATAYFRAVSDLKKDTKIVHAAPAIVRKTTTRSISLSFLDTNNSSVSDVEISVDAHVVDSEGNNASKEFFSGEYGLASFNVDGDHIFRATFKKSGYLDSGVQIKPDENNTVSRTITLVKLDSNTTGLGIKQEKMDTTKVDITTGEIKEVVVLSVSTNSNEANGSVDVDVSLPSGAKLLDEKGEPVTGPLTSTIVSFSAGDENSTSGSSGFAAFPGGFKATVADNNDSNPSDNNDTTKEVTFNPVGLVSIQIADDSGNKVKNFGDKNITITMQIPKDTVNTVTGEVIKVGDEIPIWYYNEDVGQWTYDKLGIATDKDPSDNVLEVEFETDHLTYFTAAFTENKKINIRISLSDLSNNNHNSSLEDLFSDYKAVDNNALGYYLIEDLDLRTFIFNLVSENGDVVELDFRLNKKGYSFRNSNEGTIVTHDYNKSTGTLLIDVKSPLFTTPFEKSIKFREMCDENDVKDTILKDVSLKIGVPNGWFKTWKHEGESDENGQITVAGRDSSGAKLLASFDSKRYTDKRVEVDFETGPADQTIYFTLADKYCKRATSQTINIAGSDIVFKDEGMNEDNVTEIKKDTDNLENMMRGLLKINFKSIEDNINWNLAEKLTEDVTMGMNVRTLESNGSISDEANINIVFTGINLSAERRLMDINDTYAMYMQTKEDGDVFLNGKIDTKSEHNTFTKDGTSWKFKPYNLIKTEMFDNEKFKEVEEKIDENLKKEGEAIVTIFFSDNVPLLSSFAKGKATEILAKVDAEGKVIKVMEYDDIMKPICGSKFNGEAKTDCSIKYFKTQVKIKNK